jgi:hypothetical protein
MKLNLNTNQKITDKLLNIIVFMATYLFAIYGGLWWISEDLSRGIIYIIGLYLYSMHMGLKCIGRKSRLYIFSAYIFPTTLGTFLFLIGFFRE